MHVLSNMSLNLNNLTTISFENVDLSSHGTYCPAAIYDSITWSDNQRSDLTDPFIPGDWDSRQYF